MGNKTRIAVGTAAVATAFSGLGIVGVGTAGAATAPTAAPAATCRYSVSSTKKIAVRSGPGKVYTAHGWISPNRNRPLFGNCATNGKGKAHWIKIAQGKFKGGWVWRNHLDRI